MSKHDGGPAFPCETTERVRLVADGVFDPEDQRNFAIADARYLGMSLRDYFAGQALVGMLAHPGGSGGDEKLAAACYRYADALIKARGTE